MTQIREVICLQCPLACKVHVEISGRGEILSVKDNKCERGESYAQKEIIAPMRMLTSTVRLETRDPDHPMLPVMTAGEIPKELLFKAMEIISQTTAKAPVHYGDVVIPNILGTGVDVVSTGQAEK